MSDHPDIEIGTMHLYGPIRTSLALVRAVTDGLSVLTRAGGTLTTTGGVDTIYENAAPAGVFRPVCVYIEFTAHTAGETVVVRVDYRIATGGAYVNQTANTYAGVLAPLLLKVDLGPNRYGIRVTIEKTAGANRDYPWEVFYEV